jgi:hypothetical protein
MNIQGAALIKATEVRIALTSFLQYEPMKLAAIFSAPSLTVAAESYAVLDFTRNSLLLNNLRENSR